MWVFWFYVFRSLLGFMLLLRDIAELFFRVFSQLKNLVSVCNWHFGLSIIDFHISPPSVPVAAARQMVKRYWRGWRVHRRIFPDSTLPSLALSLIKANDSRGTSCNITRSVSVCLSGLLAGVSTLHNSYKRWNNGEIQSCPCCKGKEKQNWCL